MISKLKNRLSSDILGALASALCLIHCIATPFLFFVYAGSQVVKDVPKWWGAVDIVFIIVSLIAVYQSTKNSSKQWVKMGLWLSWIALAFVILNEKLTLIVIPEYSIYIPAIALVILHLYNKKYCTFVGNNYNIDNTAKVA